MKRKGGGQEVEDEAFHGGQIVSLSCGPGNISFLLVSIDPSVRWGMIHSCFGRALGEMRMEGRSRNRSII